MLSFGRNVRSNNLSPVKATATKNQFRIEMCCRARTEGISTARSTTKRCLSFAFTESLLGQLPATTISLGFSKATFQFVSCVGSGRTYGTAIPFFRRSFETSSGCRGGCGDKELMHEWRDVRKRSSGAEFWYLGLTLGNKASI